MKNSLSAVLLVLPLLVACGRGEPTSESPNQHAVSTVAATAAPKIVKFEQLTIRQVSAGNAGAYAVAEDGSVWWLTQGTAHRVKEFDPRLTTLDPNAPLPSPGTSGGAMPGSGSPSPLHPTPQDTLPILPVNQSAPTSTTYTPPTTAVARPAKKAVKKKTITKKSAAKKSPAKTAAAKKSTKKQA